MNSKELQDSILNTLEVFQKPLSYKELYELLVYEGIREKIKETDLIKSVDTLINERKVLSDSNYIGLYGSIITEQVALREKEEATLRSRAKLLKSCLGKLEGSNRIKFIGMSGKLNESKKVDLYVITSVDNIWIARFNLFRKIKPGQNEFCFNFFSEKANIDLPDNNIKNAMEILELKPIINNDKTYENIIGKNMWIYEYFPNYPLEKVSFNFGVKNTATEEFSTRLDRILNKIAMRMQKGNYDLDKYEVTLNSIGSKP